MRKSAVQVVLGALVSVVAGSLPRGVSPDFAKFYTSKDTFACINNPSIKISTKKINDNSCDCPDGSDEPGTAACANIDPLSPAQPLPGTAAGTNTTNALPGFWCQNRGHFGSYIPFMFVNDGVCDYDLCCDGSEEHAGVGGVKCPNKCAEIGKEWRRVEEERKKSMERSGARRQEMIREARQAKRNVETNIVNLKNEIAGLEVRKSDLQRKLQDVERSERGKVVKGAKGSKLALLLDMSRNRVDELRDTLDVVLKQRDDIQDKLTELEELLKSLKEEYNPNFNDEGVKRAVKSWEDYAAKTANELPPELTDSEINGVLVEDDENNGINWKEFEEEEETDTAILYKLEAYLPAPLKDFIDDKIDAFKNWLIESGILADNLNKGTESRAVTAAREAVQAAERDLSNKQKSLKSEEEDLEKDYGPDDIFRAVKGKCITVEAGEYDYELCWHGKTSQKSRKGHGNTNMGEFVRIDREMSDEEERLDGKGLGTGERMVLRYDNGQGCWNGPRRRTDVWLACSEKEELWRVTEAEKCVYKMEVGTPAACEPVAEVKTKEKDEL